jgi:hypothetical protein
MQVGSAAAAGSASGRKLLPAAAGDKLVWPVVVSFLQRVQCCTVSRPGADTPLQCVMDGTRCDT